MEEQPVSQEAVTVTFALSFREQFAAEMGMMRHQGWLAKAFTLASIATIWFFLIVPWLEAPYSGLGIALLLAFCCAVVPATAALSAWLARTGDRPGKSECTYSFDCEGVHLDGKGFIETLRWNKVRRVRESGRFMVFFTSWLRALCIPKTLLQEQGQLETLRSIAARYSDFR